MTKAKTKVKQNAKPPPDEVQGLTDQRIPYSQEAEESVLGAVITDARKLELVRGIITAPQFFLLRHAYIFEALLALAERGDAVDYLSLTEELKAMGKLSEIGGAAYVTQLVNNTPSSENAETYAHMVNRAFVNRRLMEAADEIKLLALDESMGAEAKLGGAAEALMGVSKHLSVAAERSFAQIGSTVIDVVEERRAQGGAVTGVLTPFKELNRMTLGWQKRDSILFAGRPGMGKTAAMMDCALHAAINGNKVGIISLEMDGEKLYARAAAAGVGLSAQRILTASLDDKQLNFFLKVSNTLTQLPITVYDEPKTDFLAVRASAIRMRRQAGIELLFIDYLGLINVAGMERSSPYERMSYISAQVKALARLLNIPIISLVQLSRGVEQRQDRRPIASDMRDAGGLEQDADVVMMLYRDVEYNEETSHPDQGQFLLRKNRNGPTGQFDVRWDANITHFSEWEKPDGEA